MNFWERLENSAWVTPITHSPYGYSTMSVFHYFSIFMLVGTIALVDLRLLGIAVRRQSIKQLAEQLFPWTWTALGVAVFTGFFEFASGPDHFVGSRMFLFKLVIMVVAIVLAAVIQIKVSDWSQMPAVPASAKIAATLSLLLWLSVILTALEVANYNAV
jgi:uncharacterized membrane protein